MLAMPAPTEFDLKFRLLDIPVRVHPFFWIVSAFLGWRDRTGLEVLIWVACVFVSILVHEFGHGLTARALGGVRPTVALYGMGGLCSYDGEQRSPWRRLAVLLMGPGAGFLLGGLVIAFGWVVLGLKPFRMGAVHPLPDWAANVTVLQAYEDLVFINVAWGLFNLVPIYPLDGGQVANVFLTMHDRHRGEERCLILSMSVAGLLAFYLFRREQMYPALLVAYLGLINFQLFQAARFRGRHGEPTEDDADWWKR